MLYCSRMPFALAGADHVRVIEFGPVQVAVKSSGTLGTGETKINIDYI